MYVAKIVRNGVKWDVTVFEKRWSDLMLSNQIQEIEHARFFLYSSAVRWSEKQICKDLFEKHELEIIDG